MRVAPPRSQAWNRASPRALCIAALLACVTQRDAVASDGESALSISLGFGTWHAELDSGVDAGPTAGAVLLASYERGFTDALSWRVDASGGLYGRGGASWTGLLTAGVVYRLDVVRYVPYGLFGVGAAAVGSGPIPDDESPLFDPVVVAGLGVDVLRSRDASWGIEARGAWITGTAMATLGARYTWRWGYF